MRSVLAPEHSHFRVETAIPNGHRLQGVFSTDSNRPLLAKRHSHAGGVGKYRNVLDASTKQRLNNNGFSE
jgi:hypothetical protein